MPKPVLTSSSWPPKMYTADCPAAFSSSLMAKPLWGLGSAARVVQVFGGTAGARGGVSFVEVLDWRPVGDWEPSRQPAVTSSRPTPSRKRWSEWWPSRVFLNRLLVVSSRLTLVRRGQAGVKFLSWCLEAPATRPGKALAVRGGA